MQPQPKSLPIIESFTGNIGYRIEGISDHHIPSGYATFRCEIHKLRIEMLSFQTMKLRIAFTVFGDSDKVQSMYKEEGWKFHRTENLIRKYPEVGKQLTTPAPLFALMLNKYLQVVDVQGRTSRMRKLPVIFDQSCELVLLPDSFPPLVEPKKEKYSYYDKKATIFYSDLILGNRYEFDIELEANAGTFEFAPLFPYKEVVIQKIEVSSPAYGFSSLGVKVKPIRDEVFPEWYEEQLDHLETFEPRRPNFQPADPYRGTAPLFDIHPEVLAKRPKTKEDFEKAFADLILDLDSPIQLIDYATVRFGFQVVIPPDKGVEVNVRTLQRPLPPRIYEQMQSLPRYQDVLVRYDLFNLSKEKFRLRIETEIVGFTEKATKVVFVHGISNEQGKKARAVIYQCPPLKQGLLEKLVKPERAMMRCRVTDEDTKKTLFEDSTNIDLLANDEMIWELKDVRSNTKYDLHEFICAWITPRDTGGSIEDVRTKAAKLRTSQSFGDRTQTLANIESHAKAVYDYLSQIGIIYVNQPFSSIPQTNSQRVVLPEIVLKNKAGNCIDLVVLFASILEGAGIYSLIFITTDHAFIGWGNKNNPKEMLFLETTVLGNASFEEALDLGTKKFKDNFMFSGAPEDVIIPVFLAAEMRGCHIIDTGEVRYSGKVSERQK